MGWERIEVNRRQGWWAHLKRDLTALAQRNGVSQAIAASLAAVNRDSGFFAAFWQRTIAYGQIGCEAVEASDIAGVFLHRDRPK